MSELLVNYPDRAPERLPLGRLRITIGRSARNDVCMPDPFASRVHAEVRREGDPYVLQDLGSANGTYYNGSRLEQPVALTHGGRIQIGETEIVFKDQSTASATARATIEEDAPLPEATIAFDSAQHTTSGLLEAIEGARTQSSGRFDVATIMPQRIGLDGASGPRLGRPRRPARAHLEGRRDAPRLGHARRDAQSGGAPRLRRRPGRALPHHAARAARRTAS